MATSFLNYSHLPLVALDSTIDVIDRDESPSIRTGGNRSEQRLFDHATLLLSIANIAQSEITACPSALLDDDDTDGDSNDTTTDHVRHRHYRRVTPSALPSFPKYVHDGDDEYMMGSKHPKLSLIPRNESLRHSILLGTRASQRHRSVSFDSPTSVMKDIVHPWESTTHSSTSPSSSCRTPLLHDEEEDEKVRTPKRSNKSCNGGSNKKARLESSRMKKLHHPIDMPAATLPPWTLMMNNGTSASTIHHETSSHTDHHQFSSPSSMTMSSLAQQQKLIPLQSKSPDGITIRQVCRRKFSWKNYPQLEEFLISNRNDYLRHSALNYTTEQKNYNNTLTQDLLSLATQHGYMFDTTDFTFVTVRDRIRCYYKSYVQSAKKRGILMGYAAKKAGLLSMITPTVTVTTTTTAEQKSYGHPSDDEDDDDEEEMHAGSWSGNDSDDMDRH